MKKLIGLIKTKERDEKAPIVAKKANAKEDKAQAPAESREQFMEQPRELFWDDYSDVGYC
ncbi:MAG: hypothetical protein HY842_15880 [Bacteroidetes bacterium]|nr:hypothetical protein [Bacteroidota bacterium]